MSTLRFWCLAILLACSGPPDSPSSVAEPAAEPPPAGPPASVVIISLDTVRADRLEVYGGRAKTPNLLALAQRGTRFKRAIANMTETALSHWSMLTGALPEVHGNVPASGDSRFTGPTLAQRLKDAGFATAAFIGGETLTDRSTGLSRGFDLYDDAYAWDRSDLKRPGQEVAARAVRWIGDQTGPYFAFVHFFDAHFPYTPAAPWDTRYDPDYTGTLTGSDADLRPYRDSERTPTPEDLAHILALYDGELSELDQIIAPVLEAAGPNTLVIVTSDHGESFEHGYLFNHRDGLWDSVIRVPLLMAGPGIATGHVVQQQVELVDLAPTVLELLDLAPLVKVHGRNRAPAARGGGTQESPGHAITDPWRASPRMAVTDSKRKMILAVGEGQRFNLRSDPEELKPKALPEGSVNLGWTGYLSRIRDVKARWQGPELPKRDPAADERARLEALGYTGGVSGDPAPAPAGGPGSR